MSGFTVEFAFEIGDLVFFKGSQHTQGQRPKQFIVVERYAQQCSGGIQRLYKMGNMDGTVAEVMLCYDEPPYRPISDVQMIENFAIMENERELREIAWSDRIGKRTKEAKVEYRKNNPDTKSE